MRTRERARLGLTAMAVMALAAGAGGGGVAANSDPGTPVTLKLGTYNGSVSPFADSVGDFVANVGADSNGDITIEPQWEFKSDDLTASLSGFIFDSLKNGSLDMIIIGARMLDQAGVTSFDALHAPFLIDSDALLNAVATDPSITGPMLDGASKAGMVALAVLPEGLRHPTSFKAPFLKPSDFAGAKILTIPAVVPNAMITALGAEPSGLVGSERIDAIASGAVDGIDFSYGWLNNNLLGTMGTTTGNITTYPTYNILAVSQGAWDGLTDAQREALRKAAAQTVQQVVASNRPDAAIAAEYCANGGTVVLADAADVAAIAGATAPVVANLAADPVTKGSIERIQTLKDGLPAQPAATACEPPAAPTTSPRLDASPASLPPNGSFRAETTIQELLDHGASSPYAKDNAGVITITFLDGTASFLWEGFPPPCHADLTVVADHVHWAWRPGCSGDLDFQWEPVDGGISDHRPPGSDPRRFRPLRPRVAGGPVTVASTW